MLNGISIRSLKAVTAGVARGLPVIFLCWSFAAYGQFSPIPGNTTNCPPNACVPGCSNGGGGGGGDCTGLFCPPDNCDATVQSCVDDPNPDPDPDPPCEGSDCGDNDQCPANNNTAANGSGAQNTSTANPINLISGNKYKRQEDLPALPGTLGLEFTRHYNSFISSNMGLGKGWRHSYATALQAPQGFAPGEAEYVRIQQSDGRIMRFHRVGSRNSKTQYATRNHADGFITTTEYGYQWRWRNGRMLSFDDRGLMTQIEQGQQRLTLSYSNGGQLLSVTDPQGRRLSLQYAQGLLIQITDPAGQETKYRYSYDKQLVKVIRPTGKERVYHYQDETRGWLLTGITDERGIRVESYGYDEHGRATVSTKGENTEKVSIEYEDGQRVVTNGLGESTVYVLGDVNGQKIIKEVRGPGCSACEAGDVAYQYNDALQVTRTIYKNGRISEYEYDARGRTVAKYRYSSTGTKLLIVKYEYEGGSADPSAVVRPSIIEGQEYRTELSYTADRQIARLKEVGYSPLSDVGDSRGYSTISRETNFLYDTYGRLVGIDGPREDVNDVTSIEYYDQGTTKGMIHKVIAPDGSVTYEVKQYDSLGRVLQVSLESGEDYFLEYDIAGNVKSIDRGGLKQSYEYDLGLVSRIFFPDGSQLNYKYDDWQRLVQLTDGQGEGIRRLLDDEGNVTRYELLEANESVVSWADYQYKNGRLTKTKSKNHDSFVYEYDEGGMLSKLFAQQEDLLVQPDWLASGSLKGVSVGGQKVLDLGYDGLGNITGIVDGKSNRTSFYYDDFNRTVLRSNPDRFSDIFTYDHANNLVKHKNAVGQTYRYAYDAADNLVSVDDGEGISDLSYERGKLKKAVSPVQSQTNEYDKNGNLVSKEIVIDGYKYTSLYIYNEKGQLEARELPDGSKLAYVYDSFGRLVDVSLDNGFFSSDLSVLKSEYSNGGVGQRIRDYGNGSQRILSYDGERLLSINSGSYNVDYEYDGLGRISRKKELDSIYQYDYDGQNRLIFESRDSGPGYSANGYSYDSAGNRTSVSFQTDGKQPVTDAYLYANSSQGNRVLKVGLDHMYDKAGSLISDGVYSYEYTAGQQISRVFKQGELIAEYFYNLWGERVKKVLHNSGKRDISYYLYESKRLVAEADGDGNITRQYIYINQPKERWTEDDVRQKLHVFRQNGELKRSESSQKQKLERIGRFFQLGNTNQKSDEIRVVEPLEETKLHVNALNFLRKYEPNFQEIRNFSLSGDIDWYKSNHELIGQKVAKDFYWIHTDIQGMPKVMEDKQGEVVWALDSKAFGESLVTVERRQLNLRFPGQYYDTETGLHYNYQRYYQPQTGRFTTPDPLDLIGGLHRYNYANANPVAFADPTGEAAQAVVIPPMVIAAFYACGAAVAAAILIDILGEALSRDMLSIPFIWPSEVRDGILAEMDNPSSETCTSGDCQQAAEDAADITPAQVAAMTAEELTLCHQAASRAGDKDHPCYGGTCSAEEYDNLNTVNRDCKPKPPRCRPYDSCSSMYARISHFNTCAASRRLLADRCFKGGDDGHQLEIVDNLQGAQICTGLLPTCTPD